MLIVNIHEAKIHLSRLVEEDCVIVIEIAAKKTQHIPKDVMDRCKKRLRDLDREEDE